MTIPRIRADFNGLFSEVLCLSHCDTCSDENGAEVPLREGMEVIAFEEDYEDGKRDDLIARGIVEPSPEWLRCRGSRRVLRLDENRVCHESDL